MKACRPLDTSPAPGAPPLNRGGRVRARLESRRTAHLCVVVCVCCSCASRGARLCVARTADIVASLSRAGFSDGFRGSKSRACEPWVALRGAPACGCVLFFVFAHATRARARDVSHRGASLLSRARTLQRSSRYARAARAGVNSRRAARLLAVLSDDCARRATHLRCGTSHIDRFSCWPWGTLSSLGHAPTD